MQLRRLTPLLEENKISIQQILEQLNDKDEDIRRKAVKSIGAEVSIEISESVPLLIEKFEDENNVRREAVQALVRIGRRNNGIILPSLFDRLDDASTLIRWGAAFTIGSLGKFAKNDIPTIISCIRSEKVSSVRKKLVWALGKIGIGNDEVLDSLEEAMLDKKSEVRYKAAQAFGRIGGERAIDALLTLLLNDATVVVRKTAAEAFKKVRKEAVKKKQVLVDALQNEKDIQRRRDIAFALFYLEDSYNLGLQELERQLELDVLPKWEKIKVEELLQKRKNKKKAS